MRFPEGYFITLQRNLWKKKIVDKTKAILSVPCCGCEMNLCNKVLFKAWGMVLCSSLYLILKKSSLNTVAQPDEAVAFST